MTPSLQPSPFPKVYRTESGQFACNLCEKVLKTQRGATEHVNKGRCKLLSKTDRALKRKARDAESRRKRLTVSVTDGKGTRFTQQRDDERSKFPCPRGCNTYCARADILSRHMKVCSADKPSWPFPCPRGCCQTFSRKDNADKHAKSCKGDSSTVREEQIEPHVHQRPDLNQQVSPRPKIIPQTNRDIDDTSEILAEILAEWDKLHGGPTWEAGRKTLISWLSRRYPSLQHSTCMTTENPVQGDPLDWKDVIVHMDIAAKSGGEGRLRLWNSTTNAYDPPTFRHEFVASLIPEPSSVITPRTAFFGAKDAAYKLKVPAALVEEAEESRELRYAVEKMEKNGKIQREEGSRNSNRLKKVEEYKAQDIVADNWVMVVSNAGAISVFHIDSRGSGAFLHQLFGVKVVASCPLTKKNWDLLSRHQLKNDPNNRYSISCILLT
jgi:uncharacterized C2H2 Zn-finger protein